MTEQSGEGGKKLKVIYSYKGRVTAESLRPERLRHVKEEYVWNTAS